MKDIKKFWKLHIDGSTAQVELDNRMHRSMKDAVNAADDLLKEHPTFQIVIMEALEFRYLTDPTPSSRRVLSES